MNRLAGSNPAPSAMSPSRRRFQGLTEMPLTRPEHDATRFQERLAGLPRLAANVVDAVECKICGETAPTFDIVDFYKICDRDLYRFGLSGVIIKYYRCGSCKLIFTKFFDDWTPENFSRFVYNDEYELVDGEYREVRPVHTAAMVSELLAGCENLRILDYGSGSGRFAAEMQARGFRRVESYDPFSMPRRPHGKFDLVTCFEVIEHSVDPLATTLDMKGSLSDGGAILIGTTLQPPNIDEIRANWWYIAPRNGHICALAPETLFALGRRTGLDPILEDTLFFLASPHVSGPAAAAIARFGGASILVLSAPEGDREGWNGIETYNNEARFRWTRLGEVSWPGMLLRRGRTTIRLPFLMEITPGFAAQCRILVGSQEAAVRAERSELVAAVDLPEPGLAEIRLVTPAPRSPHELTGSPDRRKLGLAIPVSA
jgi:SAM-dependent methyltransferase